MGFSEGRKTTQLSETAMEPEEEGHGPQCHCWCPRQRQDCDSSSMVACTSSEGHHGTCCFSQTKPHPGHNWHKPSPEMSSRAEGWGWGGGKPESKDWTWAWAQIHVWNQGKCQVCCLPAGLGRGVGGVNRNTQTTHTHNTHVVTQGTRTKHALSTLSPPWVPMQPAGAREQGAEAQHLPAFGRRQTLTIN